MSAPRLEVDLDGVGRNARALVALASSKDVGVTGVTKVLRGSPRLARTLLAAGVDALGDSRLANVERMRRAGIDAPVVLLRSPMPSEVDRIVAVATASCVTEPEVLDLLAAAARRRGVVHEVLLMVELGDLREGVLVADAARVAEHALGLPGLALRGIGTNLACRSGIVPDAHNMDELSALAVQLEEELGVRLRTVSGGSSANLDWLRAATSAGRIDDLRLGESVLLGCEPLHRTPIEGLVQGAAVVVAEVIESIRKPVRPWGVAAQGAFGAVPIVAGDEATDGQRWQTLLALGHQDTDPADLTAPEGAAVLGASSDHLVLATQERLAPGTEVRLVPGYSALLRAGTSRSVPTVFAD